MIARLLVVVAVIAANGLAQDKQQTPGIQVGKKAPDFALKDQLGKVKKLSDMLKRGPVAIVFYRSAQW